MLNQSCRTKAHGRAASAGEILQEEEEEGDAAACASAGRWAHVSMLDLAVQVNPGPAWRGPPSPRGAGGSSSSFFSPLHPGSTDLSHATRD